MSEIYTNDENSWPDEVREYLQSRAGIISDWHQGKLSYEHSYSKAIEYDYSVYGLSKILRNYELQGYHCTKLTDREIKQIHREGMVPPNEYLLKSRIQSLVADGHISKSVGTKLSENNHASDKNRTGILWFCFFEPHIGTESGIGRFFRFWGGEALYNAHENDAETAEVLRQIGIACIIEAKVPIMGLDMDNVSLRLVDQFSFNKGWRKDDPGFFEGYTKLPIAPEFIKNIYQFPDPRFIQLSKCDSWATLLD